MRLTNIRPLGRYKNTNSGQEVNMKKGVRVDRGVDMIFYMRSGARVFITDREFYDEWKAS